jgi:hypothetical protein
VNSSQQKRELTAKEIAERALPGVVLIDCDDGGSKRSLGSGFFIDTDVVVTAYHVVKGMVRGKAIPVLANKQNNAWAINTILDYNETDDFALLSVNVRSSALIPSELSELEEAAKQVKGEKTPKPIPRITTRPVTVLTLSNAGVTIARVSTCLVIRKGFFSELFPMELLVAFEWTASHNCYRSLRQSRKDRAEAQYSMFEVKLSES